HGCSWAIALAPIWFKGRYTRGEFSPMSNESTSSSDPEGLQRRNIPQRSSSWAAKSADVLYRLRLTPNQISVISALFALAGAAGLVLSAGASSGARFGWLVLVALCIPLRLLCNMLDGMLAVEKGMRSPTGDLFNEFPDRDADFLLIAAAGYATAHVAVASWVTSGDLNSVASPLLIVDVGLLSGWLAAVLAVLTAYVRTLGAANGVKNFFDGPLAKPARMWVLVLASLVSMLEPAVGLTRGTVFFGAVVAIAVGSFMTVVIRL